jgi:hypothetical protein
MVQVKYLGVNGRHPRPPAHETSPNAELQFVPGDPMQTGYHDLLPHPFHNLLCPMHYSKAKGLPASEVKFQALSQEANRILLRAQPLTTNIREE